MNHQLNSLDVNQRFMADFYEANKSFMIYTVRRLTGSNDYDDIIQDAMVRLMNHIDTLRGLSKNQLGTYLYLTIKSVCSDRAKSAQERIVPVSDESLEQLTSAHAEDDSLERSLDAKWDTAILRKLLPERDWNLLEAKYIIGYSDHDIARELNCTSDSVRVLLSRARKRARAVLNQDTSTGG